ncbi:MAG: PadR family transcriptional regulator [Candidatus Aenigmarchaeota archaeon]|nr:PadR family transcriptional regulator [Candidatus Aenigmarchaeota archaeon]
MSTHRHTAARSTIPTETTIFGARGIKSDIELGMLQMQILWLLKRKPTHGYELMKELELRKNKKITQGTLYPTLQKLEKGGFVQREKDGQRIVYQITNSGEKILHDSCLEFCKTFFGIYQDFVCTKCVKK